MSVQNLKMVADAAAQAAATGQKPKSAWNQLDQLLTCAICLDRYRNPKLLPCQHTFCMEPCLEGLIDYVRRQIKCPECRAEHRIPYQGIQGYPTNVTLMRFLELHFEVTGELPDTSPTTMERCTVCTEKSYLGFCAHCEKKVCSECKDSHLDILKREISRINNQVRRGLHRLQDALGQTTKSAQQLQSNCKAIIEEIDQVYTRLQKDLKDRQETLKNEVQTFVQTEVRNAEQLKENLDMEVSNIESNCDLVEKHVTETAEWEDIELMEYKDTFLKTLEFLRNFDPDQADFSRRIKFQLASDPEAVHNHLSNVGDLTISAPNFPGSCVSSTLSVHVGGGSGNSSGGLMRSKSEHRLASSQAHQRHETYLAVAQRIAGGHSSDTESREERTSPLSRRRTGDLSRALAGVERGSVRDHEDGERSSYANRRYGREYGGGDSRSWQRIGVDEDSSTSGGYRSRYSRESHELARDGSEGDVGSSRSVRFARQQQEQSGQDVLQMRERVFETEDATRGPMSGIARLMDVPRVMQKLQQHEQRAKQPKIAPALHQPPPQQTQVQPAPQVIRRPTRQVSEEDEIAKQKAQNKIQQVVQPAQTPVMAPSTPESVSTRPLARRVAALQREESVGSRSHSPSESPESDKRQPLSRKSSTESRSTGSSVSGESSKEDENVQARHRFLPKNTSGSVEKTPIHDSTDSDTESDSDSNTPTPQSVNTPGGNDSGIQEKPNYSRYRKTTYSPTPSNSSLNSQEEVVSQTSKSSGSNSAFTRSRPTNQVAVDTKMVKKTRSKSSDSSVSSSSESSPGPVSSKQISSGMGDKKGVVPSRYGSSNVSSTPAGRPTPSLGNAGKAYSLEHKDASENPKPRFVSRFLPKAQSSNTKDISSSSDSDSEPEHMDQSSRHSKDDPKSPISALLARSAIARSENTNSGGDRRSGTSSSYSADYKKDNIGGGIDNKEGRYSSLANKYLARSRASFAEDNDNNDRYSNSSRYLTKSKSSAAINSLERDDSLDDPSTTALSRRTSFAGGANNKIETRDSRYYTPSAAASVSRRGSSRIGRSKSTHELLHDDISDNDDEGPSGGFYSSARRGSSRFHRESSPVEDNDNNYDDDSNSSISSWARYLKNKYGYKGLSKEPTSTSSTAKALLGRSRSSHALYNNREASFESSEEPGPKSGLVHLHDSTRRQSIISHSPGYEGVTSGNSVGDGNGNKDRGGENSSIENPRSMYLHKKRLLMKIGARGSEPACFTWPRGIAVGPDNGIVVADSSNHRVQLFNDQGTFRKEFGSYGSAEGEFDCLAGVAVNRIGQFIVSDRYNHRLQIFDPSGRFLRAFGSQGSVDGKLSYPWGVATDSLGFIYVCDKENHRVQVFQSDGTFVGKFGSLGSKPGQLEHPHYVAVSSTNRVVVSDSNNHRVQIFDVNGKVLSTFGCEGSDDGQFKFPRGVAVDDQGYVIVGDSGNNRVQIFTPDGTFLRAFGTWGSGDGEFKGLEGIAVSSNGEILVCDRENHRIQVF